MIDYYLGKRRSRKMGGKEVLSNEKDQTLYKHIFDMNEVGVPLTPNQVQMKADK